MRPALLISLVLGCAGSLPAVYYADVGYIQPTADGHHLRVVTPSSYTLKHSKPEHIAPEFRPGNPDAYKESGIYRHGEWQPLFSDAQTDVPRCGDQIFVNQAGTAFLALWEEGNEAAVSWHHRSGEVKEHALPRGKRRFEHEELYGPLRWWSWRSCGGTAVADYVGGDRYTFNPRTGELTRIQTRAENLPTKEELEAFNRALAGGEAEGRKED